jgi:CRP-like cAMP-binding protein
MAIANVFLRNLPVEISSQLISSCTPVGLPVNTPLYSAGSQIRYAYFLTSGIASVVTRMPQGTCIEVELIGPEGFVGAVHLMGPARILTECFMQIEGTGLRIAFAVLERLFHDSKALRDATLHSLMVRMITVSQLSSCNRFHCSEERLARWLLMARDRTQSDTLLLTQELLAYMLGSTRTTVTQTASALQKRSLISYRRGNIMILDHEGLERAACSCYGDIKDLYGSLNSPAIRGS